MKSKRETYLNYPKFTLLVLTFVLAYIIIKERNFLPFYNFIISLRYFGSFIAGIMLAYGFTAAPAAAVLVVISKSQNIFLSGIIAGFGALIGDLIIFKVIKNSFNDEIKKLSDKKMIRRINKLTSKSIKKYFLMFLAGFIIATPLPDEIGVSILASATKISIKIFSLISYILNTLGIFFLLYLGKII